MKKQGWKRTKFSFSGENKQFCPHFISYVCKPMKNLKTYPLALIRKVRKMKLSLIRGPRFKVRNTPGTASS